MAVPHIDAHDPGAPRAFTEALHTYGFAVVSNHPLPADLVAEMRRAWRSYFDGDAKVGDEHESGQQDGFHPMERSETAVGATVADLKEFFHFYEQGRRPTGAPDATAAAERLHREATAFASMLLGWVQDELPAEVRATLSMPLPRMLEGSTRTLLRVIHYPPMPPDPGAAVRAAAHEDINLLTILPASDEPGLQALARDGSWHEVSCDPGTVTVNAGDMLQLATGGWIRSATHRVVNPAPERASRSRIAMPLFLHPADEVVLAGDVTAFEALRRRILEIRGVDIAAV